MTYIDLHFTCKLLRQILYYFVFSVLSQEGAQGGFSCKNPWKKVYNGCYLLVKNDFLSWQDAQDKCTSEGGNLLAFSNDLELVSIVGFIVSESGMVMPCTYIYICLILTLKCKTSR